MLLIFNALDLGFALYLGMICMKTRQSKVYVLRGEMRAGNSPALELVGNISTLVSFLGGPCVSKNFHYKSMLSNFRCFSSI